MNGPIDEPQHFATTADQRALAEAVDAALARIATPSTLRAAWDRLSGRAECWSELAELGLFGLLVDEAAGGLGLTEVELALACERLGYHAVAEPVLEVAAVAAPSLAVSNDAVARARLEQILLGATVATASLSSAPRAPYAGGAECLVVERAGTLFLLDADAADLAATQTTDRGRPVWDVGCGGDGIALCAAGRARARAALGASAMLLGLAQRMLDMAVDYAGTRRQFGKPIGAFQAVQHRCVDALSAITFARPLVLAAAWDMANTPGDAWPTRVSMAKLRASQAAEHAAKASLQVHGAIGYSTELDLHLYMKRAWALAHTHGTARYHRRLLAERYLREGDPFLPPRSASETL